LKCQALRKQLTNGTGTARPSAADCQFLPPGGGADEQEIRHVRTGDQQNKEDSPGKNLQGRADVAHHLPAADRPHGTASAWSPKVPFQPLADSIPSPLRLCQSNAWLKARKDAQRTSGARSRALGQLKRRPHFRFSNPERRKLKLRRHHSDHDVRLAVDGHRSANNRVVASKAALPQ
jgi:hypothetical protein